MSKYLPGLSSGASVEQEKINSHKDLKNAYMEMNNKLITEHISLTETENRKFDKQIKDICHPLKVNPIFIDGMLELYGLNKKEVEKAKTEILGLLQGKTKTVQSDDNSARRKTPFTSGTTMAPGTWIDTTNGMIVQ